MDPQTDPHTSVRYREQWPGGAGQGAAGEGDSETARGRVRLGENTLDLLESQPSLGGGAGDLEDREVARDAAPLLQLVLRPGGDVVGYHQGVGVDALGAEPLDGLPEMEDITSVVPKAHQDARAAVRGLEDGIRLRARGGAEDVPAHSAVGEAVPDPAREGRVVARAAAIDDGDLSLRGRGRAHHPAVDGFDVAFVGGDESLEGLSGEIRRVIDQARHCVPLG